MEWLVEVVIFKMVLTTQEITFYKNLIIGT
jgi:hypothetical protein